MAISIRELRQGDEEVLDRVAHGVFDRCVQREWVRNFLNDSCHHLVVAIDEEVVVGMISAVVFLHPDKPPQLWINEIGVGSAHQRRGIGRQLVDATLALGRSLHCTCAWLGSEPENLTAHRLYESAGGSGTSCLLYTFEFGDAPIAERGG
ncbi:MAG: GNAT family N-acetyltransferase [Gemmatimonadota bacterium]